jgi:hypothetical protein
MITKTENSPTVIPSIAIGNMIHATALNHCTDVVKINPDLIPLELRELPQFVLWKLEQIEGKSKKIPYTMHGYKANITDPESLSSFDEVLLAYQTGSYSGIGFVFTESDPYIGIDYDHVIDSMGIIDPEILEEIVSLNSYAEISQSGAGVHVIVTGTKPGSKNRGGCREMYESKRFFVITGDHLNGAPFTVNEAPEGALRAIYEKIDPPVQKPHNRVEVHGHEVLENIDFTDDIIIKLCSNASNGEKFSKLLKGNWQGDYNSQSEADLALCSLLAFYIKDAEQIDRIFCRSGLYREKWDRADYKTLTINQALKSTDFIKEETKVPSQETASKESYIITEDRIYLNVLDSKGHHMFAYLAGSGKIEYSECVLVDGRTVYPQELPSSSNGKKVITVGIPLKESIDSAQTLCAADLYERIKNHIKKYLDLPEPEIELVIHYILFTWFYKKLNTVPYLRFLGDTGKGKTRMLNVIGNLCFYPIISGSGSSVNGIIRFNELWHGTLKVNEVDKSGKMENDLEGYFNSGFEAGNFFVKNSNVDLSKQEFFDPFGPKIFTMKRPFSDNATEGRLLSISARETTNPNIPIILPPSYYKEVEEMRAVIAKFVLLNWTSVDVGKLSNLADLPIEPRSKQLAIPLSIVLQLLPDKEKAFKDYFLQRQGEITKIRSESWDGMVFNYVYSLAIGNEEPVGKLEYYVKGKVVAITPAMVAAYFNASAKGITQALMTIGFTSELKGVNIIDNGSMKKKKTRMYVVPSAAAWREMVQRYLEKDSESEDIPDGIPEKDSESEDIPDGIPECPDVLKATKFIK